MQAKEWVIQFTTLGQKYEGFQRKHVTPYMHAMVFCVPVMMRMYGDMRKFSGQGEST